MDERVQLKVCEACGSLWYRPQSQSSPYCGPCVVMLKDFPKPETRKRRGRPPVRNINLVTFYAVADETGGGKA